MTNQERRAIDGWEAHRREQLTSHLRATPAQRLRWLEDAIAFAFRAGALPKREELATRTTRPSS